MGEKNVHLMESVDSVHSGFGLVVMRSQRRGQGRAFHFTVRLPGCTLPKLLYLLHGLEVNAATDDGLLERFAINHFRFDFFVFRICKFVLLPKTCLGLS